MGAWSEIDVEPAPEWLREVVGLVLADLQQPRSIEVDWAYGRSAGGDTVLWLREAGEEQGVGLWTAESERGVWLVVKLADWVRGRRVVGRGDRAVFAAAADELELQNRSRVGVYR